MHPKRRSYGTPEVEGGSHGSKHSSLHGSMKEEPINKKLMELAEGRPRRSREKSADSFGKKLKDKPVPLMAPSPSLPSSSIPSIPPLSLAPAPVAPIPEIKEPEPKRLCLDDSVHHTESDLSDISDDPDDILNMEDEENDRTSKNDKTEKMLLEIRATTPQELERTLETPEHIPEDVFPKEEEMKVEIEEDNLETMDFEEISDGELEEDIKTSGKGLGDALGVDWESLVKESQPRRGFQESAEGRWTCRAIFQRIGISRKYAGDELTDKLCKKYGSDGEFLLSDVAMVHAAMWREAIDGEDRDDEESEDEEVLKPFVGLFEEAKRLLEGNC